MDKENLLQELKQAVTMGQVSREEVLEIFPSPMLGQEGAKRHFRLANILYYLGGAIVFMGIAVLIVQNWKYFTTPVKILTTLGIAIACYVAAALFYRYEQFKSISQVFFLLAGLIFPIGFYVTLDKMGFDVSAAAVQSLIYLLLLLLFLGSFYFFRFTILTLFNIVFSTCLFHFLLVWLLVSGIQDIAKVYEYQILAIGLCYMLLGYYFMNTGQKALTGVLYAFGCIGFLGAALALGGWSPNQSAFWELVYPLLIVGVMYASVYVKSKAFLVFGSLFLIGYILKLTSEYFQEGLGWPLALVVAGLLIMGVGYYAVRLNKKYLV